MASAVMDQDLDSGTNPPSYEDLRIAKMLIPLFVELQVPWLNKTHKKDRFISVFLYVLVQLKHTLATHAAFRGTTDYARNPVLP
jgi:hypothetical protein